MKRRKQRLSLTEVWVCGLMLAAVPNPAAGQPPPPGRAVQTEPPANAQPHGSLGPADPGILTQIRASK